MVRHACSSVWLPTSTIHIGRRATRIVVDAALQFFFCEQLARTAERLLRIGREHKTAASAERLPFSVSKEQATGPEPETSSL